MTGAMLEELGPKLRINGNAYEPSFAQMNISSSLGPLNPFTQSSRSSNSHDPGAVLEELTLK
jgi:hypothetical protein